MVGAFLIWTGGYVTRRYSLGFGQISTYCPVGAKSDEERLLTHPTIEVEGQTNGEWANPLNVESQKVKKVCSMGEYGLGCVSK